MEKEKKYITLYYVSFISLFIALLFFIRFLLNTDNFVSLIMLLLFVSIFIVLYYLCNKALHCEEGYSIIQAISFFHLCRYAGYKETNSNNDVSILKSVAAQREFLEKEDPQGLKRCYLTGKKAEKKVTNPLIRFLWSLQYKKKPEK